MDGGINWNIAGPAGDTINALAVNPAYPSTVYAGLNGGRDGFVSTLTPNGQLYSSTYLGGSGADQGNAIAWMTLSPPMWLALRVRAIFRPLPLPRPLCKQTLLKRLTSVQTKYKRQMEVTKLAICLFSRFKVWLIARIVKFTIWILQPTNMLTLVTWWRAILNRNLQEAYHRAFITQTMNQEAEKRPGI